MNRFLPFVLLILMTAACSREKTILAAAGTQPAAFTERIETVAASPLVEIYRAIGTVRARYSAAIAAKIAASILEIRVQTGDRVTAGQTLIVLDPGNLEANLRRAEAACAETESAIAEAENAIAAASANLDLARVTHKRFEDLLAKASVSQQESDESQARLKSAGAALDMAVSKRRQAEARRSQAEADLAAARVAHSYRTLAAPFAGLVTERKEDPGSLATPGAPLLTVEREGNTCATPRRAIPPCGPPSRSPFPSAKARTPSRWRIACLPAWRRCATPCSRRRAAFDYPQLWRNGG